MQPFWVKLKIGIEMSSISTKLQMATIGALLFVLIIACIIGNLFVIIAILIERDLKSRPQYHLIFSLAVADLLVSLNLEKDNRKCYFTLKF